MSFGKLIYLQLPIKLPLWHSKGGDYGRKHMGSAKFDHHQHCIRIQSTNLSIQIFLKILYAGCNLFESIIVMNRNVLYAEITEPIYYYYAYYFLFLGLFYCANHLTLMVLKVENPHSFESIATQRHECGRLLVCYKHTRGSRLCDSVIMSQCNY